MGVSASAVCHCGDFQAEGLVDCREPLSAPAVAGAAAPAPAAMPEQYRSALLDLSKSMVWWLASSAPYCETGDGVAVAPTGLEGLLDVAVTSASEGRSPLDSPRASGPHPTHGRRKSPVGSKADPSRAGKVGLQGIGKNRSQVYAFAFHSGTLTQLAKVPQASRMEHMGLRFLLRSDDFVRDALCLLRDSALQ